MTGDRVRIRAATPADAEAIADVHAASVRDGGREAYDDEQVGAWLANVHPERYPIEEAAAGLHVVVAERDGELVGFGWLDCDPSGRDEASTGEVVAVYVRPAFVREGVGRAVLERLETIARNAGLESLVLVASKNAIEFYRRQGYEGVETVALEMQDGVALEGVRMRTQLASP